jgi:hypothetical protein
MEHIVNLQLLLGYPLLVVTGLEVLLGIVLVRQNPRNSRVNKAVAAFSFFSAAFSLSTSLMYLSAAAGLDYIPFTRLSWIGWLSIPAALQFVFYLRSEASRTGRLVGLVLYPFWAVMLCLSLFTDLIVTDHYVLIPFKNLHGPLDAPARFIGGGLIVWLVVEIIRLRRSVKGIRRAQLNYFFYGTLIFATSGALTASFLQLFGGFGFEPGLASYFSFPWVVLTVYAIMRYRLFDIRIFISNILSVALLFGLFAWAHLLLFETLQPIIGNATAVLLSLSLLVLLFFGTPFSKRLRVLVRRTVLQDRYLYQDILRESIKAIVTILDFDELLVYIAGTIRKTLAAESVALYLGDAQGAYQLRHGVGSAHAMQQGGQLDPAIVDLIHQSGEAVVREELEQMSSDESFAVLNRALRDIDAELLIQLRYKGQLEGVLAVGRKGSGEPFLQSDIDLLDALADHAAVAIENARLYDEAWRARESLEASDARLSQLAKRSIQEYLSQ